MMIGLWKKEVLIFVSPQFYFYAGKKMFEEELMDNTYILFRIFFKHPLFA